MSELTVQQAKILAFVRRTIEGTGMPPTREDISVHFGFSTRAAAQKHLTSIARKGHLELVPGSARGIRLLGDARRVSRHRFDMAGSSGPDPPLLPMIGRVAAGTPITAEQNVDTWHRIDPDLFRPRADFLHRVSGESMREANILDGDWVGVHAQPDADNGQIIVARLFDHRTGDDRITLKRYFRRGSRVSLESENSGAEYAPIEIDLAGLDPDTQEFPPFQIAGIYCGLIRGGGSR